ncbi:hypothetical protein PAXINDRAFT_14430 [Paxillus involutus ATCC 200175]|uniref:Uncharacterized protein n=1 Tax=Paxillus involutus ATCC 200175 TaxID=664439 RepID=A0A0C9TZI9_PAXIN|nr:hypothetical protein PAXINDRAFT_14430 [Paxillus involutus ATCC 200175]
MTPDGCQMTQPLATGPRARQAHEGVKWCTSMPDGLSPSPSPTNTQNDARSTPDGAPALPEAYEHGRWPQNDAPRSLQMGNVDPRWPKTTPFPQGYDSDDGSDSNSDSDMDGSHSSSSHPQRVGLESASGANEVEAMDTGSIESDEGSIEPLHEADEMMVDSGSETHSPHNSAHSSQSGSASKEYEDSSSADLDSDSNSSSPPGQNLEFDKAEDVRKDLCMSLEEIEDQLHVWLGPAIDEEFYNICWHQVMILSLTMIVIIFEPSNSKLP